MNARWFVLGTLCLTLVSSRAELNWLTDYNLALRQARAENKIILIDFTGSDWCGWCMKLKAEVFDKPEFAAFAEANLVLLEVDFPRRKPMSDDQRRQNEALSSRFNVEGYPTIYLVSAEGKALSRGGYMQGGPAAFISALKKTPGANWKDGDAGASSAPSAAKSTPPDPATLWAGISSPPKQYEDLKLTGLSGSANRRFAIINNQTFMVGETARVKLKGAEVKVLCKEIRAKSVIVQMDGSKESQELFLNTN